ncbi:winged helix-turn-helix domain-containing protein [Acholeplasma vituli]|uniref:Winged helix-turn-helix domain-containing protein n=1 Tax=Paracholeplasma vituli TaxID=69473 RepID=A0ABT2PUY2_9MOLU|nr:winged helix-turn-helix domain-containing protein [Paracholeplasma vituli]MCU0104758.1 winged helix-turn-helix domain-containing protein [Paracholeplasma vituli]
MKTTFYLEESRLLDLLRFPKILLSKEPDELYDDAYIQFLSDVSKQLEPNKEEISFFYLADDYTSHDFNQILYATFSVVEGEEDLYFKNILKLDKESLKSRIYDTLLRISEETKESMPNPVTLIESLDIELKHKWHLMLILENPVKYIQQYAKLIETIEPIFDVFYNPLKEEVRKLGVSISNTLNTEGIQAIERLSYNRIKASIFNLSDMRLLVSGIYPYSVMINPRPDYINLIWGLSIEYAFQKMLLANENKLQERVSVFKNMGDKTRYEVIRCIASGLTSIKEIATKVGVSSATISYHLNELINAKIVTLENQNKKYSYIIDYAYLTQLIEDFKIDLGFPISEV